MAHGKTDMNIEETRHFTPRFDDNGLIPAIAQDVTSGQILMVAFMNAEALERTMESGMAHYWSRSRRALWRKGETSGQVQHIKEMRTDCDQDAIVLKVSVAGGGPSCHTGRASCFYRKIEGARLRFEDSR